MGFWWGVEVLDVEVLDVSVCLTQLHGATHPIDFVEFLPGPVLVFQATGILPDPQADLLIREGFITQIKVLFMRPFHQLRDFFEHMILDADQV